PSESRSENRLRCVRCDARSGAADPPPADSASHRRPAGPEAPRPRSRPALSAPDATRHSAARASEGNREVHALIEMRDLFGITVEQLRIPTRPEQAGADHMFACL